MLSCYTSSQPSSSFMEENNFLLSLFLYATNEKLGALKRLTLKNWLQNTLESTFMYPIYILKHFASIEMTVVTFTTALCMIKMDARL